MTSPTPWAATARSCANIAFIKYWGRRDHALRLPLNGSISMNLDGATTTTKVIFDPALDADQVTILDVETTEKAARRVSEHLDRVRARAGIDIRARVISRKSSRWARDRIVGLGLRRADRRACAAAGLDL